MSGQGSSGVAVEAESTQVHLLLEQWGRWARSERQSLGANSMFKLGSTVPTPMITDDEAMRVDGIIAQLGIRQPRVARVIRLYYERGLGHDSRVARKLRISTQEARSSRRAGLAWIDGNLCSEP